MAAFVLYSFVSQSTYFLFNKPSMKLDSAVTYFITELQNPRYKLFLSYLGGVFLTFSLFILKYPYQIFQLPWI